jgi:hypothetical protein
LINVVGMSLVRQSVAIGFELMALTLLSRNRLRPYVLLIALACLFHKTAVFLLPIGAFIASSRRAWTITWICVTFVGLMAAIVTSSYEYFLEQYFKIGLASEGGGIRVGMNVVAAFIFVMLRRDLTLSSQEAKLWTIMALLSVACVPMLFFTSTAADRLALYMLPIQIFVFSRLPLLAGAQTYRASVAVSIIAALGLFQWAWGTYGNFAGSFAYSFKPIL